MKPHTHLAAALCAALATPAAAMDIGQGFALDYQATADWDAENETPATGALDLRLSYATGPQSHLFLQAHLPAQENPAVYGETQWLRIGMHYDFTPTISATAYMDAAPDGQNSRFGVSIRIASRGWGDW